MNREAIISICNSIVIHQRKIKIIAASSVVLTLIIGFLWVFEPEGNYEPSLFTLTVITSILLGLPHIASFLSPKQIYEDDNKDASIDTTKDISGTWKGSFGIVQLSQNGTTVFGEYQYKTDYWYGVVSGKIIDNKLIFHWESKDEDFFHGVGFFTIERKHLKGGYFHWQEGYSYDELLANPSVTKQIEIDENHLWELWKNY